MAWWLPDFCPERLKQLRGDRTPDDMDKLCGIAPGAWAQAEANGANVAMFTRAAIRDALHVSYDYLCGNGVERNG